MKSTLLEKGEDLQESCSACEPIYNAHAEKETIISKIPFEKTESLYLAVLLLAFLNFFSIADILCVKCHWLIKEPCNQSSLFFCFQK